MTDEVAAIRRPYLPPDLQPLLAAAGIDACVVVQARHDLEEAGELIALAEQYPFVAGVVAWLDLADPALRDTVAQLRALPGGDRLVGVRHLVQDEPDPRWLARPEIVAGLELVAASGLTYDIVIRPPQIKTAAEVASSLPHLQFVVDHLAKPPLASGDIAEWSRDMEPFGALPNVMCKVSGMVTEADWETWQVADLVPAVRRVYELFGPDRLMFGSDWPVSLLAAPYARVVKAAELALGEVCDLDAVRDRIFGLNAIRFYGLSMA